MPAAPASATTPQVYPLSALMESVQTFVRRTYTGVYWIVAEVFEVSYSRIGHLYFTLGELAPDGKVAAKVQANLWAGPARTVTARFREVTGSDIAKGMQLMLQVKVDFTPLYGLALTIVDINPEHTLGHLEAAKRRTIEQLQREGVLELNKSCSLPLLPLRLAVISSDTAAGWGDFSRQIEQSNVGSLFRIDLYPTIMQGEQTTRSLLASLDKVNTHLDDYDALLVLRGGGSRIDLSAFDEYHLCNALAQFPLPVLTGIGHERDESVADLVAHTALKTPTALAEFLIRRVQESLQRLATATDALSQLLMQRVEDLHDTLAAYSQRLQQHLYSLSIGETRRIHSLSGQLSTVARRLLTRQETTLHHSTQQLGSLLQRHLSTAQHTLSTHSLQLRNQLPPLVERHSTRLEHLAQLIETYDPRQVMRRGFIPVLQGGHPITTTTQLTSGEPLTLLLLDGSATATVTATHPDTPSSPTQ